MTRIVTCSLTIAGEGVARRLPFEHHKGDLLSVVRSLWNEVDGFVLVSATGIAVRAIGPVLHDKRCDPAVVCVDDQSRWAIALAGGHGGGGNDLARQVAALVGAEAVITTATDGASLPALDVLPGFVTAGDVRGVMRSWLDGDPPGLEVDTALSAWPLPDGLGGGPGPAVVLVTDTSVVAALGRVTLCPPSLVLGVGTSSGADPGALGDLVGATLAVAGLNAAAVGLVATIDAKASEPAIVRLAEVLGVDLQTYPAAALAGVAVPNPSDVVAAAVGTASVAEAAAMVAAGPGGALVVEKRRSGEATVAVARRARPAGQLTVVGLGPGDAGLRVPAATAAIRHADVVIGYGPYVDWAADATTDRQRVVRSPIGAEAERCRTALSLAAAGRRVALVCSGDPGVYAMASLVCELAPEHGNPPVAVIPGVTAALAGAAALGAPLGHDHAAVSLSDLLTDWETIARRLEAVASADFVVSLYNPRSKRRSTQLARALAILGAHRPAATPSAILTHVGRPGQHIARTTLGALDPRAVDMHALVIIGSSTTRWIGTRMVTPRGYQA